MGERRTHHRVLRAAIFSCLVDADRLDTACWPETPPPDRVLEAENLLGQIHAERAEKTRKNPTSPLADLRNRIFDTAIERAALPTGFFSLTVPTGGGKTLASMAFALAHAKAHNLRRIIVVIPYLSIIEQNAAADEPSFRELCSAGLAFKLAHALVKEGFAERISVGVYKISEK